MHEMTVRTSAVGEREIVEAAIEDHATQLCTRDGGGDADRGGISRHADRVGHLRCDVRAGRVAGQEDATRVYMEPLRIAHEIAERGVCLPYRLRIVTFRSERVAHSNGRITPRRENLAVVRDLALFAREEAAAMDPNDGRQRAVFSRRVV